MLKNSYIFCCVKFNFFQLSLCLEEGMMLKMKNKSVLETIILLPTILSMLFFWFGDKANVMAVSGKIILFNPITIICIIIYLISIWIKNNKYRNKICIISLTGIVLIELYTTFTWYIYTITGTFNIKFAISNIKIFGIIGPLISMLTIILFIVIQRKFKNTEKC